MKKIAILVDGGFYKKRAKTLYGSLTPEERCKELINYCYKHLQAKYEDKGELYRIFYYDCPPIDKKIFHPLLKKQIDLTTTPVYEWNEAFIAQMMKNRKVALRLGKISASSIEYRLRPKVTKAILNQKQDISELTENDFEIDLTQKGVDMKIGIDIASLAFKKQVDRIVLISGDSDFVPAAKLARREGIDFVLDPMWIKIKPDLFEHIDGLITKAPNPHKNKSVNK
ncbi:hypothetical protein HMPREF9089_00906 [Eubacterium brachy ATCC 33089]|nr:hypothetical protein HMPREF9089_00906 [Eubacterium brachy ATCC 33089]DAV88343.1 MAG TPA: hypothetical protein [Caudoviricetes sp.]